jgi:hypothetical protein
MPPLPPPTELHALEPSTTPWLDEVRAQRQAWEARREENRSAFEARRRAHNPRGAAQQEAWEEETRRRRSERLERLDQERAYFWGLGPAPAAPWPPWPNDLDPPGLAESLDGPRRMDVPDFVPQGWDNLWYFRGF